MKLQFPFSEESLEAIRKVKQLYIKNQIYEGAAQCRAIEKDIIERIEREKNKIVTS